MTNKQSSRKYLTYENTDNSVPTDGDKPINLHSYTIENPQASSNKIIIFLHGLLAEGKLFEPIAKKIMDNDNRIYKSILFDFRNHGASDRAASMTYDELSNDIIRHLDIMGLRRYILFSHSMGSKTAMVISRKRPNDVEGLIILDTYPLDYHNTPLIYMNTLKVVETFKALDISNMTIEDVKEYITSHFVNLP
jgi:pimeloyl-ACP methyl ester carboxylesterase